MAFANRLPLIRKIEELRGSKVICYLTSLRPGVPGQMADDAIRELLDQWLALPEKVVLQTSEVPFAIVESGTSSSIQKVKKRFTLVSMLGQMDQQREETLAIEWYRTAAVEQPPA